jgi:hypothetical protein
VGRPRCPEVFRYNGLANESFSLPSLGAALTRIKAFLVPEISQFVVPILNEKPEWLYDKFALIVYPWLTPPATLPAPVMNAMMRIMATTVSNSINEKLCFDIGNLGYWLSGLNVRMPASVAKQTPAGSTRTTASSSAQNPRRPVWLMVIGTALIVYP